MNIYIICTLILSSLLIFISFIISRFNSWRYFDRDKLIAVECGFNPFEIEPGINIRENFFLKFYIIGIIFLIFDLESMLLYPFTILLYDNSINFIYAYITYLIFIFILVIGLIYEIYKGILN